MAGWTLGVLAALCLAAPLASHAAIADAAMSAGCARPLAGSEATPPLDLYSHNGELTVHLNYQAGSDGAHRALYCFVTDGGVESPTLHVRPGDTLNIILHNALSAPAAGEMGMSRDPQGCGAPVMDASSVNMHFHGTNTTPTCHSDEVIHTLVNAGDTYAYQVKFPASEPPGLYWYHPHVHGLSEAAVLGGASGAIVVEGLQKLQPDVAGLPQRLLIVRDQRVANSPTPGGRVPSWDVTLNYVPIDWPAERPARITAPPGRRELWRVLNASADTVLDLKLLYDGVAQPLEVVALDGVPTGSQDGVGRGQPVWMRHIPIATAGRAEFVVATPPAGVRQAEFVTERVDVGPAGDNDPYRTLARIEPPAAAAQAGADLPRMPAASAAPAPPQLFASLDNAKVTAQRTLYFSEVFEGARKPPRGPESEPIQFYITEVGHTPRLFNANNPPAIVTTQGAVEEWTIQNRTNEVHEFHIHQIHFKLIKRDGVTLPPEQQQYLDTVQVPYRHGFGPIPSVTVLMDFRGNVTGDFVYHCHILEHEDGGMMAIIRVLPRAGQARPGV
jgi:FtsP/CotA-like multicopper oxidase with cupredoxin domain